MDKLDFINKLKSLNDFAKKLSKFEDTPDFFLEEIENLELHFLQEQRNNYERVSLQSNKKKLNPVNFVRYVILDKILKRENINLTIIDDIMDNVLAKNQKYFSEYLNHLDAIENIEERKKIFQSWDHFKILFQIYYNKFKTQILSDLQEVADFFRADALNYVENLKIKISSFDGNNYFGRSHFWIALYPTNIKSHIYAFQLFFNVHPKPLKDHKQGINYGLSSGSRVLNAIKDEFEVQSVEKFEYDKFKNFMLSKLSKLRELNKNVQIKPRKKDVIKEEINKETVSEGEVGESEIEEEEKESPLNQILFGPPGTGKTYSAIELAIKIIDPDFSNKSRVEIMNRYKELKNKKQIKFITFHQSYAYEEFIEGLRYDEEKKIPLAKPGIFKEFVEISKKNPNEKFVFIIDEINRGNISKIFGELITCIEADKREGAINEMKIDLPYSKEPFTIPPNVYIIGTMNSTDRSIALIDIALRRRFQFFEYTPNVEIIRDDLLNKNFEAGFINELCEVFEIINKRIEVLLDRDHKIGHSFLLNLKNKKDLYYIWNNEIIHLFKEYFYNDWEKLIYLLGLYKEGGIGKGFIKKKIKDKEKAALFEGFNEDFDLYEIETYNGKEENFLEILKNTFIRSI